MNWVDCVVLGLVEGITEFLPISSTGHLILARSLLGLSGDAVDRLLIVIQGAAILAVCWQFRERLWQLIAGIFTDPKQLRFAFNVLIAFLPLAILGLAFEKRIEKLLFAPIPVALALVIGGVLILWVERRSYSERVADVDNVQPVDALKIGFFQALALIPGTSRSAATILGGMLVGLGRRTATVFSFFIAIPTLLAATAYKLWEARDALTMAEAQPLVLSSIVAFISALLTIRLLLKFVSQHSFAVFAWYRIFFGGLILLSWKLGWLTWA
jgi:undecaprenyl-diphosphatase